MMRWTTGWGMSGGPRIDLKEDGPEVQPAQEAAAIGEEWWPQGHLC